MSDLTYDCVIIGAGIAGLSLAYKLKKDGAKVLVLESSSRLGGAINSKSYKSSVYEMGPNSFISSSESIMNLVDELGLANELISMPFKKSKRFLFFKDSLVEVPSSLGAFLQTSLLSTKAKIRAILEPIIRSKPKKEEESVLDFMSRRFGAEIAYNLAANFLQGVWAGDGSKLSAKANLKKLVALEQESGSVIGAMISKIFSKILSPGETGKKKKQGLCTYSFKKGMKALIYALAEKISYENIVTNSEIKNLQFASKANDYSLSYTSDKGTSDIKTKNLVFASKAFDAASLISKAQGFTRQEEIVNNLNKIEYAPVVMLAMTIDPAKVKALEGFGFLVANTLYEDFLSGNENNESKFMTLGSIFSSQMFNERNLEDEYLCLSILGGAKNRNIIDMDESEIQEIAIQEIAEFLELEGLGEEGAKQSIKILDSWKSNKAIPQYNMGYLEKIEKIEELVKQQPGLYLAGNYLHGVSLADTISHSVNLAKEIRS